MIRLAAISQPLSMAMTPTLKQSMRVSQPLVQTLTHQTVSTAPKLAPAPLFTLPGTNPSPMPTPPPPAPDSPPASTFLPYFPAGASDVPAAALDPAPPTTSTGIPVAPRSSFDPEKRLMGVPLKTWLLGAGVIGGSIVLLRILR